MEAKECYDCHGERKLRLFHAVAPQDAGLFMQAVPQAVKVVSPDRVLRSMPQLAGFQLQILE